MSKKFTKILPMVALTIIYSCTQAFAAGTDISVSAADYICTKAREGGKTRLAIYTFTTNTGDVSSDTKAYSTKIMVLILNKKEFKVIDPERVPEVISEQEKGLTGLVDPETAAETGKMIGADALVFGIAGTDSLQVRIIDAATGEVIGATLEESAGNTKIKHDNFKSPETKKKFIISEFERSLRQIYKKNPRLYLYITANESELAEMNREYPAAMKKFNDRISDKDSEKQARFEKRKMKLLEFRSENSEFDRRIIKSRKSLMENLFDRKKENHGKKKRK